MPHNVHRNRMLSRAYPRRRRAVAARCVSMGQSSIHTAGPATFAHVRCVMFACLQSNCLARPAATERESVRPPLPTPGRCPQPLSLTCSPCVSYFRESCRCDPASSTGGEGSFMRFPTGEGIYVGEGRKAGRALWYAYTVHRNIGPLALSRRDASGDAQVMMPCAEAVCSQRLFLARLKFPVCVAMKKQCVHQSRGWIYQWEGGCKLHVFCHLL